jgi:hypothetical protein
MLGSHETAVNVIDVGGRILLSQGYGGTSSAALQQRIAK